MKKEQIECSETSAYKIQTPGNYPEENIQQIRVVFSYTRINNFIFFFPDSLGFSNLEFVSLPP